MMVAIVARRLAILIHIMAAAKRALATGHLDTFASILIWMHTSTQLFAQCRIVLGLEMGGVMKVLKCITRKPAILMVGIGKNITYFHALQILLALLNCQK